MVLLPSADDADPRVRSDGFATGGDGYAGCFRSVERLGAHHEHPSRAVVPLGGWRRFRRGDDLPFPAHADDVVGHSSMSVPKLVHGTDERHVMAVPVRMVDQKMLPAFRWQPTCAESASDGDWRHRGGHHRGVGFHGDRHHLLHRDGRSAEDVSFLPEIII